MAAYPESDKTDFSPALELKAAAFSLPVLRLLHGDLRSIGEQLGAKVRQAPAFFRHAPVVIDLSSLPEGDRVEFPLLLQLLRDHSLIPVGIRGGTPAQNRAAQGEQLTVLNESVHPPHPTDSPHRPAEKEPAAPNFKIVTRPVRSGQRIYAPGGDLSITAPVSSGAEIMADGNIHVYGPLRGRALAGMRGDLNARIFCQHLEAELVSIAGHYRVSESIPRELKGCAVQIFLEQELLRIEPLYNKQT